MTLRDALLGGYGWALGRREIVFLGCLALPVVGTILAQMGKAGRTDKDGRFIASAVVAVGILAVVVEVIAVVVATSFFHISILDGDLLLMAGPPVCLAGCLGGVRWVFPLSGLGSVRTAVDVGGFVLACIGVIWLFSKFRGWGLFFVGGIGQMIALGLMLVALLKRLYRRAFGATPRA